MTTFGQIEKFDSIQDLIESEAEQCISVGLEQLSDDMPYEYEMTPEDFSWIAQRTKMDFGRYPTKEEWEGCGYDLFENESYMELDD